MVPTSRELTPRKRQNLVKRAILRDPMAVCNVLYMKDLWLGVCLAPGRVAPGTSLIMNVPGRLILDAGSGKMIGTEVHLLPA